MLPWVMFSALRMRVSCPFELLDINNQSKDGTMKLLDPVDTPTIAARLSSRIADAFAGVYPVIDIAADAMNPRNSIFRLHRRQ